MPPTLANGKLCYVEIPALDVSRSSGSTAFDDAVGEVSVTRDWCRGFRAGGGSLMIHAILRRRA
jgi:hypothetical protein